MTAWELMAADVRFTGLSPDGHPVQLLRAYLDTLDVLPAAALPVWSMELACWSAARSPIPCGLRPRAR